MFVQILLIVIGTYFLVVNGALGINWGRAKKYSAKMGQGPVRIIYAIIGAALIAFGILAILNPALISK